MKKQPSIAELQDIVDTFNEDHKIGDTVTIELDSGELKVVTIKHKATVLGGHSAVGWFDEISGCYNLDRVIHFL